MREPNIKNKFHLEFAGIKHLHILDRGRIAAPLFWRNDVVSAWCITGGIGKDVFCDRHEFWLGIYDNDKIKCNCSCYSGMCGYNFKHFFKPEEIENEQDLAIQEMLLERVNFLIEQKILGLPTKVRNVK